ncbi:MAG: YncE family protein [Proteobacteria bacterium]|nr:YncE family protein [Pseudomonadota bacterium]
MPAMRCTGRSVFIFSAAVWLAGCSDGGPALDGVSLDGTLLVTDRASGSIAFIDLATRTEVGRVPVGEIIPHEVAVSPDGQLALTSEYGPNGQPGQHIILMDVATASTVARIDLGPGSRPHTALFLPDGRHAVATMQDSDQLALVDLDAEAVIRTYATGGREGHMVRLSPDGSRAYVSSRLGDGTLSVIFLNEDRAPVVIETGPGAEGIDVSADGSEIWVANRQVETISVIDAESLEIVETLDSRRFTGRIEMGPDGFAISPNGGGGGGPVPQYLRLWDVESRSLLTEVPLTEEPRANAFGVLIHDGMAFVGDRGAGDLLMFDLADLNDREVLMSDFGDPDGMAWTPVRVGAVTE